MLKCDFSLFEQTPHLVLVRTWDVCVSTVLDVPDSSGVNLNSRTGPILVVPCSNKPHITQF